MNVLILAAGYGTRHLVEINENFPAARLCLKFPSEMAPKSNHKKIGKRDWSRYKWKIWKIKRTSKRPPSHWKRVQSSSWTRRDYLTYSLRVDPYAPKIGQERKIVSKRVGWTLYQWQTFDWSLGCGFTQKWFCSNDLHHFKCSFLQSVRAMVQSTRRKI